MIDKELVRALKGFYVREFDDESEPEVKGHLIPVAYTTTEDDECELQLSIDADTYAWVYELDGEEILRQERGCLDQLILELDCCDFNALMEDGLRRVREMREEDEPVSDYDRIYEAVLNFAGHYGEDEEDASWDIASLAGEMNILFDEMLKEKLTKEEK